MKKSKKETIREAIQVLASNGDTTTVSELEDITGLSRKTVHTNISKLKKSGMIEKCSPVAGFPSRYRYIGPNIDNTDAMEANQEGFTFPLIKCAMRLMHVNTAVHIGWKTHDGEVFCLCGSNEVARKRASSDNFDPADWHEVSPEKYKKVTCKKCVMAWYANRTREGDVLSAQDYVRLEIARDHIERINRDGNYSSTPSEPIPLDDKMADEPIIETKKRTVSIRFDDVPIQKNNNNLTKEGLGDGTIFNVQIKLVKLKHTPPGKNPRVYKCQFCCFNGLRPCPRASLEPEENRFLCYEAGPDYYFIEVLSKQG
jgi:DNA-binding Lrp family transcriptional regulator